MVKGSKGFNHSSLGYGDVVEEGTDRWLIIQDLAFKGWPSGVTLPMGGPGGEAFYDGKDASIGTEAGNPLSFTGKLMAGSGTGDIIPPTINLVSPVVGSQISAGDLITFDIADETAMREVWIYVELGDEREVIWGGDSQGFSPRYSASVRSSISDGYRYAVRRTGGWYASPTFHCTAIDQGGNQT